MAISGFSPTMALPALQAGAPSPLAARSPLGAQLLPNAGMLAAQAGADERPGIGSRIVSAMRAAVGELRGTSSASSLQQQVLAMQAQAPVTVAKPAVAAKPKPAAKPVSTVKHAHAKTWKHHIVAPAASTVAPTAAVQQPVGTTLPANATSLPGATVYSYDQNGQPVMAPTMSQLGVSPQMLAGITGAAERVDPSGPQLNATNQTNVSGLGSGVGSAVPVLGAPILTTPAVTSSGDTATATGTTGGTQAVTNRNATDVSSRNQGGLGYGTYGGYDPTGGIASPLAPYGSSMTGAYALGTTQNRGFFSRLLGL
jgi:hypothetical protein